MPDPPRRGPGRPRENKVRIEVSLPREVLGEVERAATMWGVTTNRAAAILLETAVAAWRESRG
jgi:hypothetical protein